MGGVIAEKKSDQLLHDMQVMYYVVKHERESRSLITRSGLESNTTFKDDQGRWGRDKARFDAAFDALIKGGYIKETGGKVKVGMFKSEHVLEAVKPPEEEQKSSIKKDIEKVRHSEVSD